MNEDLHCLRDPDTRQPLQRIGDRLQGGDGAAYPIVKNIPRFVSSENYAADFGDQWNYFAKTQLDSHAGAPITEERLRRCLGGDLSIVRKRLVLEAGSGAGRFTEVLLKHGATVHSFDYSSAVEANARNNGASDRLTLVQGDIRRIPFAEASYDIVVCLGVLQHTPSPEESIASLWKMVKPGGLMVIDHYRWNIGLVLPPPIGGAKSLYRRIILRMPREKRFGAVAKATRFWFPLHWRLRKSRLAQKLLARVSPVLFYYGVLPLPSKEAFYEWSLLDTHDATTDMFKHYRNERQIEATLKALGASEIHVSVGGNGVEARAVKPA